MLHLFYFSKAASEVCLAQQGFSVCKGKINTSICTTILFLAFSFTVGHGARGDEIGAPRQQLQLLPFLLHKECLHTSVKMIHINV